jgi:hypothetical protein
MDFSSIEVTMQSPTIPRLLTLTVALVAFLIGALVSPVAATFGAPPASAAQTAVQGMAFSPPARP